MSEASKNAIAEMAAGLLDEQIQARIVHYKAELETNPELDAITADVVAQLRQMQEKASAAAASTVAREQIASQQEATMVGLLKKLFPTAGPSIVVERRLRVSLRALAKLFFQSELHEKTREAGRARTILHPEQAIYYLFSRFSNRHEHELAGFEYVSDDVKNDTLALHAKLQKDQQDAFLARRSPELKRMVVVFHEVLHDFVAKQLPPALPALAQEVVSQANTAGGKAFPYKVTAEAFPRFRAAFERRFLVRLVGYAEDELVRRLVDTAGDARKETAHFVSDPTVFSLLAGDITQGVYEYLGNEGFLDLPSSWIGTAA
jgi:hypothetical protein